MTCQECSEITGSANPWDVPRGLFAAVAAHLLQCKKCSADVADAKNHMTEEEIAESMVLYNSKRPQMKQTMQDPEVREILEPLIGNEPRRRTNKGRP